jgi:tetratricopeptide (TPR) repeat protein
MSPGGLTGLDLNEQIHLDRLEFSDALGERYLGNLRSDKTPLRVTVYNPGLAPDQARLARLEERRAELGEALPPEILSLHSVGRSDDRAYIAEEAPRGPSLQALLDERKALDWQTAVRVTCGVGRALEYLADKGLMHQGLHARAIFVTDLKQGKIQLGEWAHALLAHPERPLDLDADAPGTFLGYCAYLAPESIRDASDSDQRSMVYALGMLLYQLIVGKPPFTSKSPADTLKRHLHEKPLKLSIARGGAGLHPDLDAILDTMWLKAPERRFQKIAAAMAALSSLLDAPLDEVAPTLTPAESAVFGDAPVEDHSAADGSPADDAAADDNASADDVASADDDDNLEKRTVLGMPAVAIVPAAEPLESDTPPEQEYGFGEETEEAEETEKAEKTAETEETEEAEETEKAEKTAETEETEETPSIIIDDPELRSASLTTPETSEAVEDAAPKAADEQPASETPASDKAVPGQPAPRESRETEPTADEPQGTLVMGAVVSDEDDVAPAANTDSDEPSKKDAAQIGAAQNQASTGENGNAAADQVADAPAEKKSDAAPEIGFIEAENDGGGEFAETWFGADADSAWDQSQVSEHYEQLETRRKYITFGILGLVLTVAAVFLIVIQAYQDEPVDDEMAAAETTETEQDKVDVDGLRANFDQAIAAGHLIRPYRDSAVSLLEELKRHARGEAVYTDARTTFVEKALAAARENEAENLSYAADLAGYASQFAPDDAKIKEYSKQLHERLESGANEVDEPKGSDDKPAADNAPSDESSDEEPEEATPRASADSKPEESRSESNPAPRKFDPSPAPRRSVSDILSEARAALGANNLEEAERLYREAVSRAPSNAAAHAGLGDVLFNQSKRTQALRYQKRAVQLSPGNAAYAISLGKTYYRLKQYKAAHDAWKRALNSDPGNATAKRYLGLVERKL